MSVAGTGVRGGEPVVYDGVAVRFLRPAPELAEFVIDYAFYDSGPAHSRLRLNRYPPGPANICLTFDAGPVRGRIRNHRFEWLNDGVLFGPTSHAMDVESDGGRLIGFGITPLGWARLFRKPAASLANRVTPLAELFGGARAAALRHDLAAAREPADAAAVLDRVLAAQLRPPPRGEALIRQLSALILDPAMVRADDVADRIGLTTTQLRRVANHWFGFPTKLLLRRTRFLRALMAIADAGEGFDVDAAASDYYDSSHLIKDARLFLGMTARQFSTGMTPIMAAMRRGRGARFGQPLQSLIAAGRDNVALPDRAPGRPHPAT